MNNGKRALGDGLAWLAQVHRLKRCVLFNAVVVECRLFRCLIANRRQSSAATAPSNGASSIWSPIQSAVDTNSTDFEQNRADMAAAVDDLNERIAHIVRGGDGRSRARHTARGKLLVRERIATLIDEGSAFLELSQLAGYQMYDSEEVSVNN